MIHKENINSGRSLQTGSLVKYFLTLFAVFFHHSLYAIDPRHDWQTIETVHFQIHYAQGYEHIAQRAANAAEHAHAELSNKIGWLPGEKTHLVISDETDYANGYATPIYFNRSVFFVAPPDEARGLEDFDSWLQLLITHEYTHTLHLDKGEGPVDKLRNIFGRHFLLFPNALQPTWFIEGLATHYETDLEKGIGRGQSSLYRMMMRAEVESGIKPVDQVNLPIRSWPMGTVAYLYGVYFFQFIEDVYGEQAINLLIERYSNNVIPFMINTNSEAVLDKDIEELWSEFSIWLDAKFLKPVASGEYIEGKQLTEQGYATGPVAMNSQGEVLYVENSAFRHAALKIFKDEKSDSIVNVHPNAKINFDSIKGVLITQLEFCDEYNIYSDIYRLNDKAELERITHCGRYRSAVWGAGNRIIANKLDKGISKLVYLDTDGSELEVLWVGNQTDIVTQIKRSPIENKIVASVFRGASGWNIEEFDLDKKLWRKITDDTHIDMYPTFYDDGSSIIFSSDRSGRYQVYRYTFKTDVIEQLTQVNGGAFNPLQANSESPLFYIGYNQNGYDLYRFKTVSTLQTLALDSNDKHIVDNIDAVETTDGKEYSAIESMSPRWWSPTISITDEREEFGLFTAGSDALAIHNYIFNLSYDVKNEWFQGGARYVYAKLFSIGYERSTDIYTDENGDFALARETDDYFAAMTLHWPELESQYALVFGGLLSEERDTERAPGIGSFEDNKDNLVGTALLFNNSQRYIRSISRTDGRAIRMIVESNDVIDSDYTGEIYTLDWREYVAIGKQSVLALRFVQGWGTDDPESFDLGGEENDYNILDFLEPVSEPLFGRRDYALRGYEEGLPQLSGRRMQILSAEWRFPGQLVESGWMAPPVGLIQWSASLFTEAGAAFDDSSPDKHYSSVGFELHGDVNLFYGLTSEMRFGIASGLDEDLGDNRAYFSLGASF